MDTNTENNDDVKIKKTKREKSIPGRLRGKGKKPFEEKKSLQPDYFLNYHNEKRAVIVICDNCGRQTTRGKLYRHVKTLYCARHTKDPGEIEQIKAAFNPQPDQANWCLDVPG